MPEVRSDVETAVVQRDEPIFLHLVNFSEGDDDRDDAHAEQIWDLQDSRDQLAGGVPALQQMQSLCEKERLEILITVLEPQKLIAPKLAATPENSTFSAAFTAGPEALKLEKEALLSEVDKWKDEISLRQKKKSTA